MSKTSPLIVHLLNSFTTNMSSSNDTDGDDKDTNHYLVKWT